MKGIARLAVIFHFVLEMFERRGGIVFEMSRLCLSMVELLFSLRLLRLLFYDDALSRMWWEIIMSSVV